MEFGVEGPRPGPLTIRLIHLREKLQIEILHLQPDMTPGMADAIAKLCMVLTAVEVEADDRWKAAQTQAAKKKLIKSLRGAY